VVSCALLQVRSLCGLWLGFQRHVSSLCLLPSQGSIPSWLLLPYPEDLVA
jgi:hypothetical protein